MSAKNERFWALPKAEKRIAIAKDVISSLRARRIIAKEGFYVQFGRLIPVKSTDKLDRVLRNTEGKCNCCAIGSCFVSMVRLGDNLTVGEVTEDTPRTSGLEDFEIRPWLKKIFSANQLQLIEDAFEAQAYNFDSGNVTLTSSARSKALAFGRQFKDSKDRLIAICRNIVSNNGTFKP